MSGYGSHLWHCDVTDAGEVRATNGAARPDAVTPIAVLSFVPAAPIESHRDFVVNFGGALNLTRAMTNLARSRVLNHSGSAECDGASFRAGMLLDEGAPFSPLNTNAASKVAADLALGELAAEAGLRVVQFRPLIITGRINRTPSSFRRSQYRSRASKRASCSR
ncbi:NAD-dependent epimerase/dehydratase family protein [Acidiphilium acidophilum]|uniref:NAD-dependent epimerase/dehydratase family protein n=1 Tax=Acidiphilium acidophilum TaxID=76588 RepID=UPI0038D22A85